MEEHYIEVDGINVYYRNSAGKGPCLVLLHGIPTDSNLWDGVYPLIEDSYSVYAFDLLGFGKSGKPDSSEINIKYQAVFFADVFDRLGLKDIILVGHDIGGGIAQIMAVENPKNIKAVVLMDSACYDSWPIELLKAEKKINMLFENLPEDVIHELFVKYIKGGLYNKERAEEVAEKYWKYINDSHGAQNFVRAVGSFDSRYTMEIAPLLYKIDIPVLILWGRYDTYLKLSCAYRLSEDIKKSMVEIIDCAGHFLPEDRPDEIVEAIKSFLNKYPQAPLKGKYRK